jgi:hypothetical protein
MNDAALVAVLRRDRALVAACLVVLIASLGLYRLACGRHCCKQEPPT